MIHTVGPRWSESIPAQENVDLLHSAVYNTLVLANNLECKSIAIPAISSGIFGFPKPLCARTFFKAIEEFCTKNKEFVLRDVRLTNFDDETTQIFLEYF